MTWLKSLLCRFYYRDHKWGRAYVTYMPPTQGLYAPGKAKACTRCGTTQIVKTRKRKVLP